jgi:hypothetical protein
VTDLPQVLAIAGCVGGFSCVLNLGDVSPGIRLAAVEIREAVDLRQMLVVDGGMTIGGFEFS